MSDTVQVQKRRMVMVPEEELESVLQEIRELKALLQQSSGKPSLPEPQAS